jgi:predicted enzyme related to lactoylglutathione lyase
MRKHIRRAHGAAAALFAAALLPNRGDAAGDIYWFSLLTEDAAAASQFYSDLFGWEITDSPRTGALMALRDGQPIAGISQIEDRVPDVSESLWLAAITVDDLPKAVATAKELGATIHEDITNLPGWGSFALVQDPQGAPVTLALPERRLGGRQGYSGWRWAELWTHEPEKAADFYTKVIGYTLEQMPMGAATYTVFGFPGERNAGLVALENREIASRWAPYVGVTDLRGILVRVWQLGGQVLREPSEIDFEAAGANRVALILDPTGAAMFLYQLDAQASVDPNIAAQNTSRSSPPRSSSSDDRSPNVDVHVSVSYGYGYGFGPSWGPAYYPAWNYRPFGRPF